MRNIQSMCTWAPHAQVKVWEASGGKKSNAKLSGVKTPVTFLILQLFQKFKHHLKADKISYRTVPK